MPKAKPSKIYVQRIVVRITSSRMPLDMMRYDRCVPFGSDDVARLTGLREDRGPVEVTFMRYSITGSMPEVARWHSFGCEVLSVEPWSTP